MSTTKTNTFHLIALAALLLVVAGCGDGEQSETGAAEDIGGGEVITIWTDHAELFFEHPAMIAGQKGGAWAIHFTDLSDFQPVTEGELTLEFQGAGGELHTFTSEAPSRPGHYGPAPTLPEAGMYDLVMVLKGPQVSDEIFVGPVQVFASAADIPELPEEEAVGISFLKEQQWPIDFATVVVEERPVTPGVEVTGELMAAPGGVAEVTAPVDGLVRFDLNRDMPAEGAWVEAGRALARLSPVGGDEAYASLQARAARLEREVARAERLVAAEAIPARRLVEARHDLEVVRAQLDAMGGGTDGDYVLTLRAPIAGAVTRRAVTPGQRVAPGAPLFTVLDPRRLHLRFHLPADEAPRAREITEATFRPEGSSRTLRTAGLVSVGAALDSLRRTLPVTFGVENGERLLKPGMLVTGRLLMGEPVRGLAVPSAALQDEDGLLVAYVQIGGETFERRAVTVAADDGQWSVVTSGVRPGERVVTRGQYQIKLSSLNTSEISDHGHPH